LQIRSSSYEEKPSMKKIQFIPALLVALFAPVITAPAFATPVSQQSAWDIKQPLSQNYAQTVAIGSRYEDEAKRGSGLARNFDFGLSYDDFLLSHHEDELAEIHGGEIQKLLRAVLAGSAGRANQASRANELIVDVSGNSAATDASPGAIAALGIPATSVPEPGSLALLAAGITGIMLIRRRAK
jgi:hypothetical protein